MYPNKKTEPKPCFTRYSYSIEYLQVDCPLKVPFPPLLTTVLSSVYAAFWTFTRYFTP